MMNSLRILLLFAAILSLPCTSYAQWANKPASATTIFDCAFTGNLCNLQNFYNTQDYASPGGAGAPLSPPRAFDTFLGVGSEYGNGQWGLSVPNAKEIYMGAWWSTNANFVGLSGGHNKMLQFGSAADGDNSFMFWTGAAGNLGSITWFNQTSSSNAHVAGWSGDANGLSGVIYGNCPNVPPGSGWHLLEVYQKSSSTMTSRDGILRVWVDGAMCINVTNINKSPSGTSSWQINHAWDGSAGVACTYNGGTRDCSKRWDHYWDHIIVAGGGGGGSTPGTQRVISWTDNSDNEACFHLQWQTDQSFPNWVDINACLTPNTVSHAHNIGTQTGDCYRVQASNAGGPSGFTDPVCAAGAPPPPPPPPPPPSTIATPFQFDFEEDLL